MQSIESYNDYMNFDELTGQFVLTEKALTEYCAIDLRSELTSTRATSPDMQIKVFNRRVSQLVYGAMRNRVMLGCEHAQDWAVYNLPDARGKLFRALCAQATFMCYNGDQKLSMDESLRRLAVDDEVLNILGENVHELGHSLIYGGAW